jgi:hypothetical protein
MLGSEFLECRDAERITLFPFCRLRGESATMRNGAIVAAPADVFERRIVLRPPLVDFHHAGSADDRDVLVTPTMNFSGIDMSWNL